MNKNLHGIGFQCMRQAKKRIQMKASSGYEVKFKRCHQYIRLLLSVFNDLCHLFKDNLTFIKAEFDLVPAPIFLKHIHYAFTVPLSWNWYILWIC